MLLNRCDLWKQDQKFVTWMKIWPISLDLVKHDRKTFSTVYGLSFLSGCGALSYSYRNAHLSYERLPYWLTATCHYLAIKHVIVFDLELDKFDVHAITYLPVSNSAPRTKSILYTMYCSGHSLMVIHLTFLMAGALARWYVTSNLENSCHKICNIIQPSASKHFFTRFKLQKCFPQWWYMVPLSFPTPLTE